MVSLDFRDFRKITNDLHQTYVLIIQVKSESNGNW